MFHPFGLACSETDARKSRIVRLQFKMQVLFVLQRRFRWYFNSFNVQSSEQKSVLINFVLPLSLQNHQYVYEYSVGCLVWQTVEWFILGFNNFFCVCFALRPSCKCFVTSFFFFFKVGWAAFSYFSLHPTDLTVNVSCTELSTQFIDNLAV